MIRTPLLIAAAVQAAPVYLDTQATIEKAVRLIHEAAGHGARLIAFPEVFVPGYPYWNWMMTPVRMWVGSCTGGQFMGSMSQRQKRVAVAGGT